MVSPCMQFSSHNSLLAASVRRRHPCLSHAHLLLSLSSCQATEYHLGQLKARLAKLRTELQAPSSKVGCSFRYIQQCVRGGLGCSST